MGLVEFVCGWCSRSGNSSSIFTNMYDRCHKYVFHVPFRLVFIFYCIVVIYIVLAQEEPRPQIRSSARAGQAAILGLGPMLAPNDVK